MTGQSDATDPLQNVVLEALVAAEIAKSKLYLATSCGDSCDSEIRHQAYRLERRLDEHSLFEPGLQTEIVAMSETLAALAEDERETEYVYCEGCMSGSFEHVVYTDHGYTCLEAISAMEDLREAISAVRRHLAAERVASRLSAQD